MNEEHLFAMPACMKQMGSSGEDSRLPKNLSSEQVSPQPGEGRRRGATKIPLPPPLLKGNWRIRKDELF
jgi:hypothetical protein